ncbi:MAG: hypothetical protein R3C53_09925 [Pirellulaceae bacterium]
MRNGVPELAWRFDLRENFNCTLTPFARTAIGSPGITLTQYDGMYFVPTGKISSEKHSVPTLVCLDSSTGILKWTHTLSKKDAKYPTAAGPMEAQAQLWFQDGDGRIKSISTKTGVEEYASDEVGFSWFPPIATQGQLLFVRDSELTGISGKRGLFSLSLATRIGKNIKFPGTEIRPAVFSSGYFLTDPFGQITQYHSDDGSVGPYMWTMRGLAGAK